MQMVGERATRLWVGFRSGSVRVPPASTAKTTRNARDSASVGPISRYIRIGLLSAAVQNEHRANQYAENESCFHLKFLPYLRAGPMPVLLLITYQLIPPKASCESLFPRWL